MQKKKSTHLTADDRIRIEALLMEGSSLCYIADRLDKSPSTISREIKKHVQIHVPRCCDCLNSPDCTLHHVCGFAGIRYTKLLTFSLPKSPRKCCFSVFQGVLQLP